MLMRLQYTLREGLNLLRPGQIARITFRMIARRDDFSSNRIEMVEISRRYDGGCAKRGQFARNGSSNSAAGSGDDCDLSGKGRGRHHVLLLQRFLRQPLLPPFLLSIVVSQKFLPATTSSPTA